MPLLRMAFVLALAPVAGGCGPLSAVGMIGSGVVKTIRNYNEAEAAEAPRRQAIAKANLDLAVEYMRRGDYDGSLARLERAREVEPDYAPVYGVLGVLYQRLGDDKLAEQNFRRSIKLDPSDSDNYNNYGQFLCRLERYAEAEENFLIAARNPLYTTPETPYTNAGTCALRQGELSKAVDYFNQALSLNPRVPAALIQMSNIEFGRNNVLAANEYLERYLEIAPHRPRSLWLGIRIKDRLGDRDARASYALLLRNKFPDSPEADQLERLDHAPRAVALQQPLPVKRVQLLNTLEPFEEGEPLTASQLLRESND